MKTLALLVLLPLLLTLSCKDEEPEPDPECEIEIDTIDFSFGIDYSDTARYLVPGEESDLNDLYLEEIRTAIGTPDNNIAAILTVCHWVNQNFTFQNAGGAMMGKNTVDELYEIKTFYGCHSLALIISSILREFGFPAIMIETADVQWGYDFYDGTTQNFAGHVMSEIYVENRWILLDNNCTYVEEYDPVDPFIPVMNHPTDAYFVFAKGIDIWDYSGKDDSFTHNNLVFFSDNIYCFEEMFNTVNYTWKN
ncbi:MAG: transglutaminase domain-containing protein [Bacteroidota bacterium]